MAFQEVCDLGENGVLFHDQHLLRVITRMSRLIAGNYTILRDCAAARISAGMPDVPIIDVERLSADMAAHVASGVSDRSFSIAITGGTNPDFYRHWKSGRQAKRLSADVFVGIVRAMGRDPLEYVVGAERRMDTSNASVLTAAFATLLESVGISPYEDERAQKLARRFPDALRRASTLHEDFDEGELMPRAEDVHGPGADQPAAGQG